MKIIVLDRPIKPMPEMHKTACAKCPSAHHEPDAEVIDIKAMPHDYKVETAFACAWSPVKFCKGYCDYMGISNADLKTRHSAT